MSEIQQVLKDLEKLSDDQLSTVMHNAWMTSIDAKGSEKKAARDLMLAARYVSDERDPKARIWKVVRSYQRAGTRVIATDLTLAEALAHCNDPETSSSTATSAKANAITRRNGPWFDGFTRSETFAEFKRGF